MGANAGDPLASMTTAALPDPARLIDRARYPVDRLEGTEGRALVARCREQLARRRRLRASGLPAARR